MPTETGKFYEEGNDGFYIFSKSDSNEYTSPKHIKGLISFDGSWSRSVDKKAADDQTNYLIRVSPATVTGTISVIGLSNEDYVTLYGSSVKDKNGVVGFGNTNEPNKVGVVFFNKLHNIKDGVDTVIKQAHCFYSVTFDLPPITTTTLAEDSTDTRPFELSFTADPIYANNEYCTYKKVTDQDKYESGEDKIWDSHFSNYQADEGNITMYIPGESKPE